MPVNNVKIVIGCTLITLFAIVTATYFIYEQIHPMKCESELVTVDVPDHRYGINIVPIPREYVCERTGPKDLAFYWVPYSLSSMWVFCGNTCVYKKETCWRD